jgi:branched-chain amino acid aminotransferase
VAIVRTKKERKRAALQQTKVGHRQKGYVYVNGELVPRNRARVSVFDHGLLYGDGVFEGIRAYDGVVFRLKEHIQRLYDSANYIKLGIPLSKEQMTQAVLDTLRKNGLSDGYIRLVVTRGVGDLGVSPVSCKRPSIIIITESVPPAYGNPITSSGISAIISSIRRDPVDATSHEVKSLNYLNSVLARMEAIEAHVSDAIMLDTRGFVSEATAENVFIVKGSQIATPATSSAILHGVTRQRVIELGQQLGFTVVEKDITPFELLNSEEVFLTGTLAEIVPVVRINGRPIGEGKPGKVTIQIFSQFAKIRGLPDEGVPIYGGQIRKVEATTP